MSRIIAQDIPGTGLGNKMFINALAYVLSLSLNRELVTFPIEYFNNTKINSKLVNDINNPLYTRSFGNHYIDFVEISKHKGDIVVNSFVQKFYYYTPFKKPIQSFYCEAVKAQQNDNIIVHIRNGDYKDLNLYPGLDFYVNLITNIKQRHNDIEIVCNHIDDDIKKLQQLFNIKIISNNIWEDFTYLCSSKNIILSQSTFCWWAAFLNNKTMPVIPLCRKNQSKGCWYDSPDRDDIDLKLHDGIYLYY